MILTQVEFQEWLQHPITKSFFKSLSNNREELKENIVVGLYEGNEEWEVKGICKSVARILEVTYEEVMEGLNYGK